MSLINDSNRWIYPYLHTTMTDPIKAKIIELVPDMNEYRGKLEIAGEEEITLADVLRAIEKCKSDKSVCIGSDGSFCKGNSEKLAYWNLTTDYDGQTQEVKEFIGKLLGV